MGASTVAWARFHFAYAKRGGTHTPSGWASEWPAPDSPSATASALGYSTAKDRAQSGQESVWSLQFATCRQNSTAPQAPKAVKVLTFRTQPPPSAGPDDLSPAANCEL